MRSALCIVVTVLFMASVSAVLGAQVALKTEISGYSDYLLGADQKSVLAIHPSLRPGAKPITDKLPVVSYAGVAKMPASWGDVPDPEMTLHFWQGRLAVIRLYWADALFRSRSQSYVLSHIVGMALLDTYDKSLVKANLVPEVAEKESNAVIQDVHGNTTVLFSLGDSAISLTYYWGPFDAALKAAPKPPSQF